MPIEIGGLGVVRLFAMVPTPIGQHMSVVWNGDSIRPTLKFDGWTEDTIQVLVEVWGS